MIRGAFFKAPSGCGEEAAVVVERGARLRQAGPQVTGMVAGAQQGRFRTHTCKTDSDGGWLGAVVEEALADGSQGSAPDNLADGSTTDLDRTPQSRTRCRPRADHELSFGQTAFRRLGVTGRRFERNTGCLLRFPALGKPLDHVPEFPPASLSPPPRQPRGQGPLCLFTAKSQR